MKIPRFYTAQKLSLTFTGVLEERASSHAIRVLRLKAGEQIRLFDGTAQFLAEIIGVEKRGMLVKVLEAMPSILESPLNIHLGQGISKGDRMDIVIQKAVELGVAEITPVITERCEVRFDEKRAVKKMQHWLGIIVSACEQCERDVLPKLNQPQSLAHWLAQKHLVGFVASPFCQTTLSFYEKPITHCSLLIGPEGGLTDQEVELAKQSEFYELSLGPRVLRTETAAITALSLLQSRWGDLF